MYTDTFPTKEYKGEVPLLKEHILTQHLPLQPGIVNVGGKFITEDLPEPFNPHDPQIQPYSMGLVFSKRKDAMTHAGYSFANITVSLGEYEFSDDQKARGQPQSPPLGPLW